MGINTIAIPNVDERISDKESFVQSVENTYSVGNKYRHQELVEYDQEPLGSVSYKSGIVVWNKNRSKHIHISHTGGGGGDIMELDEDTKEWVYIKDFNNTPQTLTPWIWVYSEKYEKYYGCGDGISEYDEDFNYTGRGYSVGGTNMMYDTKRDLVVHLGSDYVTAGASFILQSDPSGSTTDDSLAPGYELLSTNPLLNLTDQSIDPNETYHLVYSKYDDNYYFFHNSELHVVNPDTGSFTKPYTASGEVMSFVIDIEDPQYAYMIVEDGANIKLHKMDLSDNGIVSTRIFENNKTAYIQYTGKVVVLVLQDVSSVPFYAIVLNKDLSLDLSFKKNMYVNFPASPSPQFPYSFLIGFGSTTSSSKGYYRNQAATSDMFQTLSSDQTNIHFPVVDTIGPPMNRTLLLNINPVTSYPSVTADTSEDCCLDDLLCELNTKLAKNSCEATNRAIVGRHYGNVWDNSELLEVVKWVTEFDCLSCDDIEALRCIISKI